MSGWLRGVFIALVIAGNNDANAQVIPPSAQPGRERERFTEPVVPRAQPRLQFEPRNRHKPPSKHIRKVPLREKPAIITILKIVAP
jgi:hypothetical protein